LKHLAHDSEPLVPFSYFMVHNWSQYKTGILGKLWNGWNWL